MALFNNTPMQPTVADLQELISSRIESIQSGKGIAAKPEKVSASKEDLVLGYFREVFNTTKEKADSVRGELAPTMEVLARESALLNAQEREAAGITQSLVEGGGEAYRYEAQDVNNISNDEFNSDFAKDEQESAPITAETDTVEAAVAEAVGTQGPGIMSRQSTNGLPAYIQEGSAFRQALADQEAESYSTIFGNTEKEGKKFAGKDITSMKMSEVFDFVKPGGAFNEYNKDAFGKNTTAIGKYQMVGATLRDLRDRNILDKLGIKEDTTFNRETQDKIAMHLAERRVKGRSLEAARKGMRNEWEGFKKLDNEELDAIINEIGR
jgi:hypothetical protein